MDYSLLPNYRLRKRGFGGVPPTRRAFTLGKWLATCVPRHRESVNYPHTAVSRTSDIYLVVADILRLTASLSELHWYHLRFRIVILKLRAVAFGNGEKFLPQKKRMIGQFYNTNMQSNCTFKNFVEKILSAKLPT